MFLFGYLNFCNEVNQKFLAMQCPPCCANDDHNSQKPVALPGGWVFYLTKIIFLLTEAFPLSREK
jgi:hypothetical protein